MTPEEEMDLHMLAVGIPPWESEYRFHPKRRWRLDRAWPDQKIGLEIHGGVWTSGRHNTGSGFTRDREKMNEATILGWRILEVTTSQVRDGSAIHWVQMILGG